MTEIDRILDQMDRAFSGDAWHGPPLKTLIDGLLAEDAARRPVEGAHSIWEIVQHVAAWNSIVRRELTGEDLSVTSEQDWPPVGDISESAWHRTVENLIDARGRLRTAVKGLRDEQLDEKPIKRTSNSRYVMLHGIVQHDLYHGGQIAVLKKALSGAARRAGHS
jgi:uncharacterized damage-inducible protein DinB